MSLLRSSLDDELAAIVAADHNPRPEGLDRRTVEAVLGHLHDLMAYANRLDLDPDHVDHPSNQTSRVGGWVRHHAEDAAALIQGQMPLYERFRDLRLATSSYKVIPWGVPVATSVRKPRGWAGPTLNQVAPYGIFNVRPALPRDEFEARYLERLDKKAAEIDDALEQLARAHPGQTLVIACWCDITPGTPDHWCHRTLFSEWATRRYGHNILELTDLEEDDA